MVGDSRSSLNVRVHSPIGQFVLARSLEIGVSHTCGRGVTHSYGTGVSHTYIEGSWGWSFCTILLCRDFVSLMRNLGS